MLTYYGIPPEFRGDVHLWNRHTPSGQSRVYRVTQLRTDGVHCRESAGTGPVNLKVVPNECCLARLDQLIFASLSHTHYWYEVGMLKVPAGYNRGDLFLTFSVLVANPKKLLNTGGLVII